MSCDHPPKPDPAAFLAARLDEDEAAAKAAPGEHWKAFTEDDIAGASVYDDQWLLLYPERYDHDKPLSAKPGATGPQYIQRSRDALAAHIARHDPARVLREVAADRKLLAEHHILAEYEARAHLAGVGEPEYAYGFADGVALAVRIRAERFADHPDYDPAWRP